MSVYERSVRVRAPLEAVWEFHSTPAGLTALTPDWTNLRVEAVRLPDDTDTDADDSGVDAAFDPEDPPTLVAGSELDLSVRPFGVGPRQRFTSRIRRREVGDGTARFVDDMVDGPFAHWEHTHSFFADGETTLLRDRVEYRLPGGRVGGAVSPLAVVGFAPTFWFRHRRTRALLEGD